MEAPENNIIEYAKRKAPCENGNLYIVYKHTLPNGMYYIGATYRGEKRWGKGGCHYKSSPIFFSAINEVGWNNVRHEILFSNLSSKDARRIERDLIIEAQEKGLSLNKIKGGYNAIYKDRMHEIVGLRKLGLSYKQIGEIYNVDASTISEIVYSKRYLKDYTKEDFEKKVSDFVNRNRGKYVRRDGRTFSKLGVYSKNIVKKDKEGNIVDEYQSIVEAAKTNRILHTSIVNNLKGRSKTCGGFIYEYKQN